MTLSTTANRVNYTGDGVITQFSFSFKTIDDSHILPHLDAVEQGSGFTVTRNADQDASPGGVVDFTPAPAADVVVTIERIVPNTQGTDYTEYDPFPAETHETALDLAAMRDQQLDDAIERAIKADVTAPPGSSYTLPVPNAGSFLQWNVDEDGFINVHISELGDLVVTTPFTESLLDDVDADEFWATIMATIDKAVARNSLDVYSKTEINEFNISNTVTGTDTYAVAGLTAYTLDRTYPLSFTNTNTIVAPTIEFGAAGAKTIKNPDGSALAIGAIPDEAFGRYDGTDMILLNPVILFASPSEVAAGTNDGKSISPLTQGDHQTACKAWVNFNGTGTIAERDSYNVLTLDDNGTGLYDVNFDDSMNDINYSFTGMNNGSGIGTTATLCMGATSPTINTFNLESHDYNSLQDKTYISVQIFGA